jgi:hypothetical protein
MFTHTFLIRHPEKILRSYLRLQKKEGKTTFFDVNEVAYKELLEVSGFCCDISTVNNPLTTRSVRRLRRRLQLWLKLQVRSSLW